MTFDNGKELALHELLSEVLNAKAYFSHPNHSWEKGLNENTNGLIQQYFPKGISFDNLTIVDVKRVENLPDTRPRKCIDYATPNDILTAPPTDCASRSNPRALLSFRVYKRNYRQIPE